MIIVYSSNNSGGDWWLEDKDWFNLEKAGWKIDWKKDTASPNFLDEDGRWLGALATSASFKCNSIEEAIESFSNITGQSGYETGCDCCGSPHSFYESRDYDPEIEIKISKSKDKTRLKFI